jgi:hypothetical protein
MSQPTNTTQQYTAFALLSLSDKERALERAFAQFHDKARYTSMNQNGMGTNLALVLGRVTVTREAFKRQYA